MSSSSDCNCVSFLVNELIVADLAYNRFRFYIESLSLSNSRYYVCMYEQTKLVLEDKVKDIQYVFTVNKTHEYPTIT